ncbi:MAG: TetR/AcrR family transcriptional regulator [Bacteroidota bacterium]
MTTQEKILEAARVLLNSVGIDNVSARTISAELNISPGNFTYYYTNKNQVIADLYKQMKLESQSVLASLTGNEIGILTYLEAHKRLFLIQEKYKFFYLNMFEILTNNPEVKERYLNESKSDRKMARELLKVYVDKGILKRGIGEEQFERLINVGQILNNSWLVDAEVLYKGNQKKKLSYYMSICCGLLEPFLTEDALKQYHRFFTKSLG